MACRSYYRLGVLTPAFVGGANGYCRYREAQLATARLIAMLRRLGMPLSLVAEVASASRSAAADLVGVYWQAVEERVASQRHLAMYVRAMLLGGEGSFDMFEIKERDVPDQLVLTEQRHVRVPELESWLMKAMVRLDETAERYGGTSGPEFVIFHGEVNEDSDGPVEVCAPIDVREAASDAPMRREPAHREAYVRLTKAQTDYPQILSAYDAVEQWITSQGRSVTGSPREIYFTDFAAARPHDEVCDVAFPME